MDGSSALRPWGGACVQPAYISTCLHPAPRRGISEGVSQPESQREATGSGEMGTAQRGAIFRAYQNEQRTRSKHRYLLYPAALLVVLGLGAVTVSYQQSAPPIRVDTRWGLRTVRVGMSPQDVSSVLGQPTSKERRGDLECYEYGRPTIKEPTFTLHVICYEDGKLREVSEKRYNSWVVTQDGAISPAPLEYAPTPGSPSPTTTSAPGLAGKPTL